MPHMQLNSYVLEDAIGPLKPNSSKGISISRLAPRDLKTIVH